MASCMGSKKVYNHTSEGTVGGLVAVPPHELSIPYWYILACDWMQSGPVYGGGYKLTSESALWEALGTRI